MTAEPTRQLATMTTKEEPQLTLHEMHLSGNCYKIRLVASLLGLKLKLIEYNNLKGETQTADFKANVNANGKIPVLQIGTDIFLPESGAACYYLANTNDSKRNLIPEDRLEHARMLQWMFFEQYSHEPAIAVLRFWHFFVGVKNLTELQKAQIPGKEKQAREVLDVMERHLEEEEGRKWFVGSEVTLADVVLFAYTHRLHEAQLDLGGWKRVKEWCERVEALDGFVGIED